MHSYSIPHRLGTTAIAAVIALSATPLLAQTADPQAEAPLIAAPPAPATAPEAPAEIAPALNAAAPEPDSPAPTFSTPASGVTGDGVTIGTPVASSGDNGAATATRRTPITTRATTAVTATAPAASTPVARAATPPLAPAAAPITAAPESVAAPAVATRATTTTIGDDTAEWAGAGALGLIALAGGAFLIARRRREDGDEDAYSPAEDMIAAPAPVTRAETPLSAPAATPAFARAATESPLPPGFDLSRFGRHVQAAYRGPTPDNPSATLRTRLRRAAFFDQREREALARVADPAASPDAAAAPLAAPALRGQADRGEQLIVRPNKARARSFLHPSLTS